MDKFIPIATASLVLVGGALYYLSRKRAGSLLTSKTYCHTTTVLITDLEGDGDTKTTRTITRTENLILTDEKAIKDIRAWREQRDKDCRNPFGWLSLAGLHWLIKGDNVIGTSPSANIIFDVAKKEIYPEKFGIIILREDETLVFKAHPGVEVTVDGKNVSSSEEVPLVHDNDSDVNPTILSFGALQWFVIKRSTQYGIRLKDSNNPVLVSFPGINNFPINLDFRVEGTFKPYTPPKQLQIQTGIGTIDNQLCPGYVSFNIAGTTHTLDVTGDRNTKFHVVFADTTTNKETYGGGRMLNIPGPTPGSDKVLVDFNKAYNPPCAFTDFATCGLPLPQNRLKVAIRAGELKFGNH